MKLKYIIALLALVFCAGQLQGQNIVQAEYYFDTDPGYENATAINIPTPTADINGLLVNATVAALSGGFHTMYVRTKDALGRWSHTNNIAFAKHVAPPLAAAVLNITKAEYYFDADPGYENGVDIPITASADISNLLINADVTALSQGFHTLYVRVRDAAGKWSVVNNYPFAKHLAVPGAATIFNINKAEYYFDTDPGYENGVDIPLTASTNISNLLVNTDVTALSQGFHTMYVRVRDAAGKWSVVNNYPFAKHLAVPAASAIVNITTAEYFFDTDPGYGNGTNITVTPSTDINNLAMGVDVTALTSGFHTLYIRTADAAGKWSETNTYPFAKHLAIAPAGVITNITRIEYFLDTDPGIGNATPVAGFASAPDVNNFSFNAIVSTVPLGPHTLYVRTQDESGRWSITNRHSFNGGVALPITLLAFDATLQKDNTVLLNWNTEQEINLAHYELERSTNGTSWKKIGQVTPSAPNSTEKKEYKYLDENPGLGLLYYRLRNTDLDGNFAYSDVRTVLINSTGQSTTTIFPNPSNGKQLSIKRPESTEQKINARIINAGGITFLQQSFVLPSNGVYTFDNLNLPAGSYFLMLEIGTHNEALKFLVR